jgi:hypothetical protein
MKNNDLKRLLIEACDLLIILENDLTPIEVKERITAIFMELKYADRIDSEMIDSYGMLPDQEVQDWDIFGKQKI